MNFVFDFDKYTVGIILMNNNNNRYTDVPTCVLEIMLQFIEITVVYLTINE